MDKRDRYDSLFLFYLPPGHPVPWKWAKAQAMAESNMNKHAISSCGAKGLIQFMDATWKEVMGPGRDPFDPEDSIQAYSIYSKWLLTALETTDLEKMTAAYNCGPTRIKKHSDAWRDHLPAETETYVERVRNFYAGLVGDS